MKDNSSGEQRLLEHLKKLFELYKNNKLKEALKYSNKLELDFSKDLNIPYFHNLKGLINLGLRDWEESLKNFNQAIEIDKNFEPSHFNKYPISQKVMLDIMHFMVQPFKMQGEARNCKKVHFYRLQRYIVAYLLYVI